MNRVFITGDKHGDHVFIKEFCENHPDVSRDDSLIILGDSGYNFFLNYAEHKRRKQIAKNNITVLCVHGNHEERPYNIRGYKEVKFYNGIAYKNWKYPNLYFAKDGENYEIGNHKYFILGGAYSTDKYQRLEKGIQFFYSEQPNDEIKEYVEKQITICDGRFDIVLSHTCPMSFVKKANLKHAYIDPKHGVDWSTELWLSEIEKKIEYNHWYFAHFHQNRIIDEKKTMLYTDIIEI